MDRQVCVGVSMDGQVCVGVSMDGQVCVGVSMDGQVCVGVITCHCYLCGCDHMPLLSVWV